MGDEIMKTLKQIFNKHGINDRITNDVAVLAVIEWLQQYDEDWSINGLLEQLDQ